MYEKKTPIKNSIIDNTKIGIKKYFSCLVKPGITKSVSWYSVNGLLNRQPV